MVIRFKGRKTVTQMPMTTLPVGRFLIDVPKEAEIDWGRQGFEWAGPFIQTFPVPTPELLKEALEAEADQWRVPHKEGGMQLEKIVVGNIPNSWFTYYWKDREIKFRNAVEVRGYFWNRGRGFVLNNDAENNSKGHMETSKLLEKYFHRIALRAPREIPVGPGFCFDHAYFQGEPARQPNEHIAMHITFPSNPDVYVRFCTDTVNEAGANGRKLLERVGASSPLHALMGVRRLRGQERKVGPYQGQELVERVREANLTVGYTFMWEYQGQAESATAPSLMLEMFTGYGEPPVNSSLSRKQALALWDAILDSIRYRTPETPASEPEPR